MARIPEAEIERLKNEVAVERLAEAAGHRAEEVRARTGLPAARSTPTRRLRWWSRP